MVPVPNLNVLEVPKCKFVSGASIPIPSLLSILTAPNEPVDVDEPLILILSVAEICKTSL